jgi:DNA repair protein RecO (recombination protein O)
MEWTDRGIVLHARPHGETSSVVSALTAEHGRHAGLVRGARRSGGTYEPGNLVQLRWRARLDEHLGNYSGELIRSPSAAIFDDALRLAALAAACALVDAALPERERHDALFQGLESLLGRIESAATPDWLSAFVRFEVDLLRDLGFGLDLTRCAATGATDHLAYVSPKTGRAVSESAGAPYRDKLLLLPAFLTRADTTATPGEILQGLTLTGYFLDAHVFAPHGKALPPARTRLVDRIAAMANLAPATGPAR